MVSHPKQTIAQPAHTDEQLLDAAARLEAGRVVYDRAAIMSLAWSYARYEAECRGRSDARTFFAASLRTAWADAKREGRRLLAMADPERQRLQLEVLSLMDIERPTLEQVAQLRTAELALYAYRPAA